MSKYISIIIAVFVMFFIPVTLRILSPVDSATEALKDAGYHPIEVGGYSWFSCGQEDLFSTNFKALSPDSSRTVTGAVCQGLFKGKTIRLD